MQAAIDNVIMMLAWRNDNSSMITLQLKLNELTMITCRHHASNTKLRRLMLIAARA
jgi:hypothetical protein